ncbi:MAG: noncanonical pyrimidine nucleotidase, YjjG family [Chitinophagaceae bacterium]|nr:noncanonical pyrimidine nucleotidase, YjjG family [Chitinophagaceae bacterium]
MGKYKHLFFDLDHTLWDFNSNARLTLEELYNAMELSSMGILDFELFYTTYLSHNDKLWEKYRNGIIKVDELRWKRMWYTLIDFKIGNEKLARDMGFRFLQLLPTRNLLFPHTIECLDYLTGKGYSLHLITNGFEETQHSKLKHAGIDSYFIEVITSEGSNSIKPKKEIFEYAFLKANAQPHQSIMIGDSIEVDIRGAMNVGMDQVFVNHTCIDCDVQPTYMIHSLKELERIF